MTEQTRDLHYNNITKSVDWIMILAQKLNKGDDRLQHLLYMANDLTLASTEIVLCYTEKLELESEIAKLKRGNLYLTTDLQIAKKEIIRIKDENKKLKLDDF